MTSPRNFTIKSNFSGSSLIYKPILNDVFCIKKLHLFYGENRLLLFTTQLMVIIIWHIKKYTKRPIASK